MYNALQEELEKEKMTKNDEYYKLKVEFENITREHQKTIDDLEQELQNSERKYFNLAKQFKNTEATWQNTQKYLEKQIQHLKEDLLKKSDEYRSLSRKYSKKKNSSLITEE